MNDPKVLLATMRSPFLDNDRVYPSLGVLYLQAVLDREGIRNAVTDEFDHEDTSRYDDYDVWAASVMIPQKDEALRFLAEAKEMGKFSVIGGPYPTYYMDEVKRQGWDFIAAGDGERSILRAARKEPGTIVDLLSAHELAGMPRPKRLENATLLSRYGYELQGVPATSLITGRGCPMSCGFCEAAETKLRYEKPEKIAAELDDIVELGYKGVYVFDDLFALTYKRAEEISRLMAERGLIFRANGHAKTMTREMAEMLASNGLREIAYGAESGSQKILDTINKKTTVRQNYEFIKHFEGLPVSVKAFLMLGLPGETYQTISETEEFIIKAQPDDFQLSVFYPYRGTPIRENMGSYDLQLLGEGSGAYAEKGGVSHGVVRTRALTAEQIEAERDRLVNTYKPKSHQTRWKE